MGNMNSMPTPTPVEGDLPSNEGEHGIDVTPPPTIANLNDRLSSLPVTDSENSSEPSERSKALMEGIARDASDRVLRAFEDRVFDGEAVSQPEIATVVAESLAILRVLSRATKNTVIQAHLGVLGTMDLRLRATGDVSRFPVSDEFMQLANPHRDHCDGKYAYDRHNRFRALAKRSRQRVSRLDLPVPLPQDVLDSNPPVCPAEVSPTDGGAILDDHSVVLGLIAMMLASNHNPRSTSGSTEVDLSKLGSALEELERDSASPGDTADWQNSVLILHDQLLRVESCGEQSELKGLLTRIDAISPIQTLLKQIPTTNANTEGQQLTPIQITVLRNKAAILFKSIVSRKLSCLISPASALLRAVDKAAPSSVNRVRTIYTQPDDSMVMYDELSNIRHQLIWQLSQLKLQYRLHGWHSPKRILTYDDAQAKLRTTENQLRGLFEDGRLLDDCEQRWSVIYDGLSRIVMTRGALRRVYECFQVLFTHPLSESDSTHLPPITIIAWAFLSPFLEILCMDLPRVLLVCALVTVAAVCQAMMMFACAVIVAGQKAAYDYSSGQMMTGLINWCVSMVCRSLLEFERLLAGGRTAIRYARQELPSLFPPPRAISSGDGAQNTLLTRIASLLY